MSAKQMLISASVAHARGDYWGAFDALRQALQDNEPLGEAAIAGRRLAGQIGDDNGAVQFAQRYCHETGNRPDARFDLAEALTDAGRAAEAVDVLAPVIDAGHLSANHAFKFTRMLMFAGRRAEAHDRARGLLETNSGSPTLWERLANTKTFRVGDPDIDRMRAVFRDWPESKLAGRAAIAAALTKAAVDVGDDDLADLYIEARAVANRARFPFHPDALRAAARDVIDWCQAGELESPSAVSAAAQPIFILGPSRSGTTLMDQVFSRHPRIAGGGERRHFWLASSVLGACDAVSVSAYLRRAGGNHPQAWSSIGRRYLALAAECNGSEGRFTDKLLSNIYRVRAIRQSLPGARVIFMLRDPLAVAWSCWRAQFDADSAWANDPAGIALYISTYRAMMAAWAERYPEMVVTVSYEDLVRNPETTIPRILSACDLDDNPATREPQKSDRPVATLSFDQVRQPIHTRSIDGLDTFPKSTRRLREALDEFGLLR
jgi:tetratricopeptide (TPR) repeat protein